MALVVEDGTGLSTAESYASVANADAYIAKWYGADADWTAATTDEKETALRQGTRFIDFRFGNRWIGFRTNEDQALDWPMQGVEDMDGFSIDTDEMPTALIDAASEMAYRYVKGDRFFEVNADPSSIKMERVKVGPIETETEYAGSKPTNPTTEYPVLDRMLRKIIYPAGTVRRA